MLTKASDYYYVSPPAGRICGNIIPAADIAGRLPALRFEDVCYLHEMMHDFYEGTLTDRSLPSGVFPEHGDLEFVWSMCSTYRTAVASGTGNTKLSAEIPADGLESAVLNKRVPSFYGDFLAPLADTHPEYFLIAPFGSVNPFFFPSRMSADDLRLLYWLMSRPRYDAFTLVESVGGRYECAVDQPIGFVLKSFSGGSGHSINEFSDTVEVDGVSLYESVGGMHCITTWAESESKYWLRNGCPQSDVVGRLRFAEGVEVSAAFMAAAYVCSGDNIDGHAAKLWLEPLTASDDGAWEFKFFDMEKAKALVASQNLPWEDGGPFSAWQEKEWDLSVRHSNVFAMVSNRATDLPAEWDWTPGS